jgi:D-alanine-D-alanine ligase
VGLTIGSGTMTAGDAVLAAPRSAGAWKEVEGWDHLERAPRTAWEEDSVALVEEAVPGRGIEMGVLEYSDGTLKIGPPLEIKGAAGRSFFDFGTEYDDAETPFEVPAALDDQVVASCGR